MSARPNDVALKQIGRLFRDGTVVGLGDGDLIARFVARRDETAFEALVTRHGPMVLGVCRRMLHDPHDADDAFQATFLVLVRKARTIRDADRLAAWLHGVAHRVAGRARIRAARRAANETTGIKVEPSVRPVSDELTDVRSIIDAELARLSAKHREVLVLCLLEGLSTDQAAARLRCPAGTIKSRLARGRETLKTRLTARGLAPSLVAGAVLGSAGIVRASVVPERLITPLLRAAIDPTNSLSAMGIGAAALTREAMIPMVSKSVKLTAFLVGGLALGGVGVTEAIRATASAQQQLPVVPTPETEQIFIGSDVAPGQASKVAPGGMSGEAIVTATHMRDILLAFHNYHAVNDKLPKIAIWAPDGLPALSWRVAILPFMDQTPLYNEFHLDEPWDSPHNMKLVERMPKIFETPDHPTPKGETRFRGFSGKGTAFDGEVSFAKVTDGMSNTAILGIAAQSVPWTRPEGLTVDKDRPLPQLERSENPGPLLGIMDGSLRRLKPEKFREKAYLLALTSIAGGEIIDVGNIFGPSPELTSKADLSKPHGSGAVAHEPSPTPGGMMGTMSGRGISGMGMMSGMMGSAPSSPSIEQRLEAIERKLDLLLEQSKAKVDGPEEIPAGAVGGGFN